MTRGGSGPIGRAAAAGPSFHRAMARRRSAIGDATVASLLAAGLWAAYGADRDIRAGIEKSSCGAQIRPQDDLYRHVNGAWIAEAKIPAEYGLFGSFMQLRDNAL